MTRQLLALNLRRVLAFYVPLALALVFWMLTAREPLGALEPVAVAFSAALGLALALHLFRDPPGEAVFLYSRALSRDAIFWSRWKSGIALLAVVILACALIVLLGLRATAHPRSVFYPMIRLHELRALWSLAMPALLVYQFTILLLLRERTLPNRSGRDRHTELILFPIMALLVLHTIVGRANPAYAVPYLFLSYGASLTVVYPLLVVAVTTFASLRLHRRMEIG